MQAEERLEKGLQQLGLDISADIQQKTDRLSAAYAEVE